MIDNNIGYACTRQQCESGYGEKLAFRFIKIDDSVEDISFAFLEKETNQFANALQQLGFEKGEVFFTFLPKCRQQVAAFLGSLKLQLLTGTLFANFGDEAVLDRLKDARAKGIITRKNLYKKLAGVWPQLPDLRYIILIDSDEIENDRALSYNRLISSNAAEYDVTDTESNQPAILHYTSGSTGKPKGVVHVHNALQMHRRTVQEVLQLEKDDFFWCTADPGWVTGTSYGIIGPASLGISQLCYEGGMNVQKWFEILEQQKVTVWYTAPTALRMIMQESSIDFGQYDLGSLRTIFSVGEPLNPEILHWSRSNLKKDIYDTYFQTETGAIMISNRPGLPLKPGSMGQPVDGIDCEIIDDNGEILPPNVPGNLCLRTPWPSMFITYLNNPDTYANKFVDGYYYTGDQAYKGDDGYFWFIGRKDDIINTAGHLVSPFEVESAILEMDQVLDVAVIPASDSILFEKIVAFIKVSKADMDRADLDLKIRLHVSKKVSPMAAPSEVVFIDNIPKNKSGKIMRRYLRAQYEGRDPGDISTMDQ